jgi:hypothetical protein
LSTTLFREASLHHYISTFYLKSTIILSAVFAPILYFLQNNALVIQNSTGNIRNIQDDSKIKAETAPTPFTLINKLKTSFSVSVLKPKSN